MKRFFAFLAFACLTITLWGQDAKWTYMNPYMQITINHLNKNNHVRRSKAIGETIALPPTALLVKIAEGADVDALL